MPVDPGYVPVAARLIKFRADHPDWPLISELLVDDGKRVVMVASVYDAAGRVVATGHAEESRQEDFAIEKGETSAWGRALANLGYEVVAGIASAEEMDRVPRRPGSPAGRGKPDLATARSELDRRLQELAVGDQAVIDDLNGWLRKVGLPEYVSKMNIKQTEAVHRELDRREAAQGGQTTGIGEADI
jgi:hypothetical protein